jgi:Txe/YoeB family toxin of toxin-antitoxin system
VSFRIVYSKAAQRDARKISRAGLRKRVEELIEILAEDPYRSPPRYEKLVGDLTGAFSRRINIQHRLVYQVLEDEGVVKILRMWTHYE